VTADLVHFGHDDAWSLGAGLVERCRAAGHPVTILIMIGQQRVFHAALPGTNADRDRWVERKARVVSHFGMSTMDVFQQYVEGKPQFFDIFALPASEYAPFGGAIPITIQGTLVGALAISGLTSEEDHDLANDALLALAARQAGDARGE